MTSWVLTIAKDYPNHWDIAKENGLWDMATSRPIKSGDVVYFWISKHGFIGRVEVTDGATPLTGNEDLPWTDEGEREYVSRFRFRAAADMAADRVSWSEVQENTGFRQSPSWAPHSDDSAVEAWLSSLFEQFDAAETAFVDSAAAVARIADLKEDSRERALAEIAVRRGQGPFRKSLLSAYGRRCTVTGTAEEAVLEAAHISPYRGEHTNVVANGLLLRSDIHTLFDLHLLTVRREGERHVVHVSPALGEDIYRALDGRAIGHLPRNPQHWPSAEALADHNEACPWLAGHQGTVDFVF
ncbi:HNH endonuclease [Georgenia subflava]|nr:HNH endonuclease [Georgenia subflava]